MNVQDPTLTERTLGVWFTELETYIDESGERTQHPLGYASAWFLVALAKLVRGMAIGSDGNDDLLVIAGDIVGSFLGPVALYSLVRDLINSGERVVRLTADGTDRWTMACAVVGIAAALTRFKVAGRVFKLLKVVGRGDEAAKAVAKLAAIEARIAAGARIASKAEKLVQLVNGAQATGAAVQIIITKIRNSERAMAFLNSIFGNSPEPEAVAVELAAQSEEMADDEYRLYLTALGRETSEPSVGRPLAHGPPGAVVVAAVPRGLLTTTVALLKGFHPKNTLRPLSEAGRYNFGKTLIEKLRSGRSVGEMPQLAAALRKLPPATGQAAELLKDLASCSSNKRKGAEAVLKVTQDIADVGVPGNTLRANLGLPDGATTVKALEDSVKIASWTTKTGKIRKRLYDLVLNTRDGLFRIEVKVIGFWPLPELRLKGMSDQMRRDLVKHMTHSDFSLSRLRWVFSGDLTATQRRELIKELQKATKGGDFKKRLIEGNRAFATDPVALQAAIQKAHDQIDTVVVRFHDLDL